MTPAPPASPQTGQLALDFGPPPAPTLENFIVGANAECLAALAALLAAFGAGIRPAHRFIYIWGAAGTGKSHLARAVARRAADAGFERLVVVDDCDQLAPDRQIGLFHRFNELSTNAEGALVAFGQSPPARLDLIPELASRLAWGLVFALTPLSEDEQATALAQAARARGLVLGPEVTGYLQRHAQRDLGTLTTILDRLDRLALQQRRPVTLALLREALGGVDTRDPAPPPAPIE